MEEKSIKIKLNYSDENGVSSEKEMSVKINTVTLRDKSTYPHKARLIYTLSFSLKIPDHIHSFLIGKSVPTFGMNRRSETMNYSGDFAKTIKAETIERLTERWSEIITDYEWLKNIDKLELKKVIFYKFDNKSTDWSSDWNRTPFGKSSDLNYNYAIGFISESTRSTIRYNSDKKTISISNDRDFYQLKYVEWSEERQAFFDGIQNTFEKIINNLSSFEEGLSESTINSIISNKPNFLIA